MTAQGTPKTYMVPMKAETARALSALVYVALPLGFFADAIWPEMAGVPFVLTGVVKLAGLLGAMLLFLSVYGQRSQQGDAVLDERERDERNRAYLSTHHIMLGGLFGFFIYATFAQIIGWWLPTVDAGLDLLSAFAIGSLALPGAILAWRDRAEPDEG